MKDYTEAVLRDLIPYPGDDVNKYSRGKLTLLVGSAVYPGAASLAAMASQRAGAGYAEVFVEDPVVHLIQMYHPSLVVRPWSNWDTQFVASSQPDRPCAYVAGCGFDATDPFVATMARRLLRYADAPVLVDGGALKMLPAKKIRDLCERRFRYDQPTVITPHMGEAKVLAGIFGLSTEDPQDLVFRLAQAYGVICVLKGPDTYISDGDEIYAMTEGTSALAKAGTGDVLAGIIGAFLAQKLDPVDACVLGTTLHARAGKLAAEHLSSVSVCAEDIIRYLPRVLCDLEETEDAAQ